MSQTGQMSREDMLRELELLPVWQLRQPLPTPLAIEKPAMNVSVPIVAEQAQSASGLPEAPAPELIRSEPPTPAPTETVEAAAEPEPVLVQAQTLPLRVLLSEDSAFAFLIAPYAAEDDRQAVETLLKNMVRAMQASCRVDVTDATDNIFTEYMPKLIISMGAEPANALFNKSSTVDAWRNNQQENQPLYKSIPVIVTYHPAYLLENTADKAHAWRDLCLAMKLVPRL